MEAKSIIDGLVKEGVSAAPFSKHIRDAFMEFRALDGDDPRKLGDLVSFLQMKLNDDVYDLELSSDFREILPYMAKAYAARPQKKKQVSEDLEEFDSNVTLNDDTVVQATVKFDFDTIGPGDAGYTGRPDVSPWIEDVVDQTGKSVIDLLNPEEIEGLRDQAARLLRLRRG